MNSSAFNNEIPGNSVVRIEKFHRRNLTAKIRGINMGISNVLPEDATLPNLDEPEPKSEFIKNQNSKLNKDSNFNVQSFEFVF
jgi:hypothetical protein